MTPMLSRAQRAEKSALEAKQLLEKVITENLMLEDKLPANLIADIDRFLERRPATNSEMAFEPGEVIEFCGDQYTVVSNYGDHGEVDTHGEGVVKFCWVFEDTECTRVY